MLALLSLLSALTSVSAQEPSRRIFYAGTARYTVFEPEAPAPFQLPVQSLKFILMKEYNPARKLLAEIICMQDADPSKRVFRSFMHYDGKPLLITDSPDGTTKLLTGTWSAVGKEWDWTALHFSMNVYLEKYRSNMRTEDVNFVIGKHLVARKQMYLTTPGSPEKPYALWEAEAQEVDPVTFERSVVPLQCPAGFNQY